MTKKYADLHVHTRYSDSTLLPEEVVNYSVKAGLSAIAITDHDTVNGIQPTMDIARKTGLEVVPGIELTVENEKQEIHILGYYIDWRSKSFIDKISVIQRSRIDRIIKMTDLLNKQGVQITPEAVFNKADKGTVGRLHVASVMVELKITRSIEEAFRKYIGFRKPCYVEHLKFSPEEAVDLISRAGGVPVVAHPNLMKDDSIIDEMIGYGLKGIEVFHTDHDSHAEKKYTRLAKEKGLLVTGGSDCHGLGKGRVLIGTVMIDYAYVEALKQASKLSR